MIVYSPALSVAGDFIGMTQENRLYPTKLRRADFPRFELLGRDGAVLGEVPVQVGDHISVGPVVFGVESVRVVPFGNIFESEHFWELGQGLWNEVERVDDTDMQVWDLEEEDFVTGVNTCVLHSTFVELLTDELGIVALGIVGDEGEPKIYIFCRMILQFRWF